MTMNDALRTALKTLRLSGIAECFELRVQEAMERSLTHQEFLELLLEDELAVRNDRAFRRRLRAAGFRDLKTLEEFDWGFNPTINKQQIYKLASPRWIRERRDAVFVGPPGVGKSHLVQAAGYALVRCGFTIWYRSIFDAVHELKHDETFENHEKIMTKYLKPDLLILDDMGMKKLPPRSGEYLFEIVMRRYERRSTYLTTNRPLEDWGKLVGDVPAASAILDRLLHHAEIVKITGRSYRLHERIRGEHESGADSTAPESPENGESTEDAGSSSCDSPENVQKKTAKKKTAKKTAKKATRKQASSESSKSEKGSKTSQTAHRAKSKTGRAEKAE